MKCPFCGEEMEHGYLYASQLDGFPWYPEGKKPPWNIPDFRAKKKGAISFGRGKIVPFEFDTLSLWVCKKCMKGVADKLTRE